MVAVAFAAHNKDIDTNGCLMNTPAIKIEKLNKSYKDRQVLDNICLEVGQNEILAFMGPNGAGKTTAVNILTGLIRPDSGEIYYSGQRFDPENLQQKRIIGVVPQNNNLERDLTVEENLTIHGYLFGFGGLALQKKIDEVLEHVDLLDRKATIASQLSGGMKRRLVIARALMHDPRILFLDEPSAGLDPLSRKTIHSLVRRLNRDDGVCVFLTTHYVEEAATLASQVVFLSEGCIVGSGTPAELKENIGKYALECIDIDVCQTSYFQTRDEAVKAAEQFGRDILVREVTLEDAYIKLTGKKIR